MSLIITAQSVRDYLELNTPASSSKYSDDTIGSNIAAATSQLEQVCHRWFANRPAATYTTTSMLRAVVPVPGFRAITSVTYGGSAMTANQSFWALPDPLGTGLYTGLQFRAFRVDPKDVPWYLVDSGWWDKALDSPFYPGNYGGGYVFTSMPNDMVVVGDGGYDPAVAVDSPGGFPSAVLHAVKVLAAFYTMRPASILADVAITPAGGVLNYSQMPAEVRSFIATWTLGQQVVSV